MANRSSENPRSKPKTRITVKLNQSEAGKILQADAVRDVLTKIAEEIAKDTEARYKKAGKDYSFETDREFTGERWKALVVSNDGDAVRYSEAKRGILLREARKKRPRPNGG